MVMRRRALGGRRRRLVRKRRALRPRRRLALRRLNPRPTFTETFKATGTEGIISLQPGQGAGYVFKARISDIPQVLQYATLYSQYRINWIKAMLIPNFNTSVAEVNAANANAVIDVSGATVGYWGSARIVWAVQDTPNEQIPANEDEVLKMNGCKIRMFKTMWSQSFKPVPDVAETSAGAGNVYAVQRYRQFFNFDTSTTGNNPEHGSTVCYITLPGNHTRNTLVQTYNVFYKVNFTLKDPK